MTYRRYPDGTIEIVETRTFFNGDIDPNTNKPLCDAQVARDYRAWLAAGNEPEDVA